MDEDPLAGFDLVELERSVLVELAAEQLIQHHIFRTLALRYLRELEAERLRYEQAQVRIRQLMGEA